ncbi:hypothetical protein BOTBODRAFT_108165 [Botryobasidium botryosum FD-172 SS1]|uniref:DUF1479-domain-containing protein n=1 Tax=Botryobasidium botryosum (strain FD-172 SS1) TaxID=930990 RepID=A0A067MJA0_BOTB1|nr:hypothetical protein BOTBODRAFT_108165 [Botryobasidium botryosum FD-172 SS1]
MLLHRQIIPRHSLLLRIRSLHSSTRADIAPSPRVSAANTKDEGTIADAFASLAGAADVVLPERFAELKRTIVPNEAAARRVTAAWAEVLGELRTAEKEILDRGSDIVPQVNYADLSSLSGEEIEVVKKRGTVVIRNVVNEDLALGWKEDIKRYIQKNPQVRGFPADNKQVFEIYWSKSQIEARSHPHVLSTQTWLSSLWQVNPDTIPEPNPLISLSTPLSYVDRLRIRLPGDAKFALGPHIDGGSLERWEDEGYRRCYKNILEGRWREHDAFDIGARLYANSDLYNGSSQCGVFRSFQGWLSLSNTGPNEGTLRVYPNLLLSSAYVLLRPFFKAVKPLDSANSREDYLEASNWTLDLASTEFPNSVMGRGQELNEITHPHLRLENTMVSVPRVKPGDMVFWHCDGVHAVESVHRGEGDSSVLYIPAAPLTEKNMDYTARLAHAFLSGSPPEDFPGGKGEAEFVDRGNPANFLTVEGARAMALKEFEEWPGMNASDKRAIEHANRLIRG